MAVHTYLLDFTLEPSHCETVEGRTSIKENIESCLKEYISDLRCDSYKELDGGFLALFFGANGSFITVRGLKQGIVTINIEYYKPDLEDDMLSFEQLRLLELSVGSALASTRSKHLPPIKRGAAIDVYLTTSGSMLTPTTCYALSLGEFSDASEPFNERILEYDIDKVVFEETSPYQKIQIVHSKSLGNLLLLDELQNMSESDLIYTETLMQRGIEDYEGKEIIILGGGDGCLLWELLKEQPKFVTMLELDEVVIKACGVHLRSSCGNCLDNYKGDRYEIIVGDCFETLEKFIREGKKVDYVFGDLTDVPVDSSGQNREMWQFIRLILNKSMQVIRPGGKYLSHGNGASAVKSLQLYENVLNSLNVPVTFTKAHAFIPSFLEDWARGPKKHLKRLNAPKAWMLDKLGGVYAPRPSTGPHKLRESLPLVIFLRNRLKYALTNCEVKKICMQRLIKVDGKIRTDPNYPTGFMDVVSIEKINELFRLIYDVKGRFTIHRITPDEATYKLCKVKKVQTGPKGVPFLVTHDGRTIRYPDPLIKVNDSIQLEIATSKILDFLKFESGNLCMITGGRNLGRVGTVMTRERHPGSFDIVHIKDSQGHTFATRLNNVFIIGKGSKAYVSLPRGKGVKLSIAEERDKRLAAKAASG
ncbi:hypothetical protein RUM44_013534 [Polyplax serrata]|uniref:Small ribosomal subunit protein eS4 n=1 Tax=Polyplax serrata TaxID=468196 RepID=A0ABR1BIK3_POLSC